MAVCPSGYEITTVLSLSTEGMRL